MSNIHYTLSQIAQKIGAEIKGDPNCLVEGVATLVHANNKQLSFLDNPHYKKYLSQTKAAAIILAAENAEACPVNALVTVNPYLAFAKVAQLFAVNTKNNQGIHASAIVGENCRIAGSAQIDAHCVIGNNVTIGENVIVGSGCHIADGVTLGDSTKLYPKVCVYYGVSIGQRVVIHSGVVIGSDGFGFANDKGVWVKVPQLGSVRISDDVEIGANTTIDRGALPGNDTIIAEGVKLDNQIQIGHNVYIGAHTAVAGCVGIAGSTTIGKYCMIAGGTGIGGHLEIADRVIITGMSRVTRSLTKPGIYSSGSPLQTNQAWRKSSVRIKQLDEMATKLDQLYKQVMNSSEG